jgi:hypothetical protein
MKLFDILLSGDEQTIALVVAAETLERAEELALKEYGIEEADSEDYGCLRVYRSSEIRGVSATVEIVREIFNTNEL